MCRWLPDDLIIECNYQLILALSMEKAVLLDIVNVSISEIVQPGVVTRKNQKERG